MLVSGGGDLLLPAFLLWSLPGPLPCDTLGLEGGEASVLVTGTHRTGVHDPVWCLDRPVRRGDVTPAPHSGVSVVLVRCI